ncbi:endonuclease III [Asticcacaulis endophyticus]|uniref:Endonuclease III n=1 Tax=Asticcacaulis endophyticus TaxID=1395890 RepID=A0A918PR35_9CAUL|nr:endonuclease III [Asticcacaulis endophyticus]GGZ20217.1 endonuclease III [Asticcacaulis endophyticus]
MPDPRLIEKLFTRFEADKPDPKTELDFINPYTLVVAVALSAQTTDKAVNKATKPLFDLAYNPFDMVALGEEKLSAMIASIGLYRTKAKNVIRLSQILIDSYGGQVPLNREALMALPGVGRKTASVVLNELNIEPAIAVDTHVYRVSHRLGIADATTPDKVEAQLMAIIPQKWLTRAHHWLILHGRYTCVARKPMCGSCIVADLCPKIGV